MLALGIPTIRRYDALEKCLESAERGSYPPDVYLIVDNGGKFDWQRWRERLGYRLLVHRPEKNLGVAGSWNYILDYGDCRYNNIAISNDDVEFHDDTLEKMLLYSVQNWDAGLLYAETSSREHSWSLFIYQDWLRDKIGLFDDQFWPAYFEDNDMARRIRLAGYELTKVPDCYYDHIGSATIKSYTPEETEQHHIQFRRNESYYISKWGGKPGEERFTIPFNGNPCREIEMRNGYV